LKITRFENEPANQLHVTITPISGWPSNALVKVDGGIVWVASNLRWGDIFGRLAQTRFNPGRVLFNTAYTQTEPAGVSIRGTFGVKTYDGDAQNVVLHDIDGASGNFTGQVSAKKQMADSARINDTLWVGTTNATKLYDGWYLEGSYLCTLSGFTETVTCTTYYVKCGKAVTLTFSTATGTSNTGYIHISTGKMPASIRPAREMFWNPCRWSFYGFVDTDPHMEYMQTFNNVFAIVPFVSSGDKAILYSFSISYLTY
jgi:hypothetical protein